MQQRLKHVHVNMLRVLRISEWSRTEMGTLNIATISECTVL